MNKEEKTIWRYMEFAKFAAMLKAGALHFSRADKFDDPFEGSYPLKTLDGYPNQHSSTLTYEAYKKYAAVSCWHENPSESEAMWQLYSSKTNGVAIASTEKLLRECVQDHASVIEITYIDFLKDAIDDFSWFKAFEYKRKCFEHEREIRASIYQIPPSPEIVNGFPEMGLPNGDGCIPVAGLLVEFDLGKLIQKVVLVPKSESWFKSIVEDTLKHYSLGKIQVIESELSRDPAYPHLAI